MSKRRGIWAPGLTLSAARDWCKRALAKYQRFAGKIANQLRPVGRENRLEVGRVLSASHPMRIDLGGNCVELGEFVQVLNIGDRIRVLCDDGVLVAEKISQTQLKVIQAERMAEIVH
jgi:hypothetical protein